MGRKLFERSRKFLRETQAKKEIPVGKEPNYYPFGLTMVGISDKAIKWKYLENKFRYNKKEIQNGEFSDETGLEAYDYGARFQDPQIGRWMSIDPLLEKMRRFSPYIYGGNNPIKFVDLEGFIIGNPNDEATKKAYEILNRTTSGQELWVRLEASPRKIYFHNVGVTIKSGNLNLVRYMTEKGSGATMSKTQYENILAGKPEPERNVVGAFNRKTGDVDKSPDWDETHIVLKNLGVNGGALDETRQFAHEAGIDDLGDDLLEATRLNTISEESEHALQDYYDENEVTYDEKTQTYTETPRETPYANRKNEKEAKKARMKIIREHFENFQKSHPELFGDKKSINE